MAHANESILTLELLDRFARTGCQCKASDPVVLARFDGSFAGRQWFAICYHPRVHAFFGIECRGRSGRPRWRWFTMDELLALRGRDAGGAVELWEPPPGWRHGDPAPSALVFPLRTRLDPDWTPVPASEAGVLPD